MSHLVDTTAEMYMFAESLQRTTISSKLQKRELAKVSRSRGDLMSDRLILFLAG